MSQNILVTGGSGLVGSAIKDIIINTNNNWIFLSSKDGDLTNFKVCEELFNKYKPDIVIHLAANVGGLFKNLNNNSSMFFINMYINMNILQLCEKYNVKKVISCLSTCVFPDNISLPLTEGDLHNGEPHYSNRGYSYSKRMLEVMSDCLSENTNTQYINIIPTNIYGPNDNFNINDGHVIPSIIHKMYLAEKNNKNLILRGTGKPLRQFIYSLDMAKLVIMILNSNHNNIGNIILSTNPQEEISIKDVSAMISKHINFSHKLTFENDESMDGQYRKTASNQKLLKMFPTFSFTPINEGLKQTIDWFINNYNVLRK